MKSILEHGLRIPEDISVVDFDNIRSCDMMNPKLTSVCYNYDDFEDKLVTAVTAGSADAPVPAVQLIRGELILRDSTRPVKKV